MPPGRGPCSQEQADPCHSLSPLCKRTGLTHLRGACETEAAATSPAENAVPVPGQRGAFVSRCSLDVTGELLTENVVGCEGLDGHLEGTFYCRTPNVHLPGGPVRPCPYFWLLGTEVSPKTVTCR